jgi:hypothetical protein
VRDGGMVKFKLRPLLVAKSACFGGGADSPAV